MQAPGNSLPGSDPWNSATEGEEWIWAQISPRLSGSHIHTQDKTQKAQDGFLWLL